MLVVYEASARYAGAELPQAERVHRRRSREGMAARMWTPPRRALDRAPAVVALRDRVDDRQPEPDAARRPASALRRRGRTDRRSGAAPAFGIPAPSSPTSITTPAGAVAARAELDRRRARRVLDGVLEQRVERGAEPLGVRRQPTRRRALPSRHARGATSDQRMNTSSRKCVELDLLDAGGSPAGRPWRAPAGGR